MSELTELLDHARRGEQGAREALMAAAYQELREMAQRAASDEGSPPSLQPAVLVKEAWLRLFGAGAPLEARRHYFGAAAQAMRRVMVDRARLRRAQIREAGLERVSLGDEEADVPAGLSLEVLELDRALSELDTFQPRLARMLELRYFVGLDLMDTAAVLGVSPVTVKRDWAYVRGWLLERLGN
ncbi:sigma-70 family RNA polymerase sigma factor [Corallococcus macrosporus]|uniref:RNA polymerase ECF-subfamily sigma factor n=1 Tax=Myxococcus fulvus (strain ATCC BAA-855 / HW-1) TaxID=483219 RepID=F8CDS9_MYXFH|nr:sigma-70 family RNA polymerase sigma factor [Corallococcus macrosporus]AEI68569.1 RNA polymerase ECF-subfamily sigma factor [Corallococcus macrosporus]